MNAEDYHGEQPRLEGVQADMERIMEMTEGSRYSIIGFDSSATQQLPLTTDAGAAAAWIDTLETEPTAYSQRSEEHTSELQSRGHLVCRLLHEKKKTHQLQ